MNKVKLGEILKIKHGFAFKSENYVDESEYALVTLANISSTNNFQFNKDKTTFYGASFPNDFILKEDDLIMPLTEQVVGLFGNTAFVPKMQGITFVLNQRVGKVVPVDDKADKYYLHYLLATNLVKDQLEFRASGTRQRNISPDDVYDVEVFLPDITTQRKIGKCLYDIEKKVNLNNAINDNLASMAYDIYMHTFFSKKPNGKLKDILIEADKSSVQVGEAKQSTGEYPFFTSGSAILKWDIPFINGRNCFLNTGGNADVKFYVGEAAYSTDTWCISTNNNMSDYLYLLLVSIKPELNQKFFQGTGLKHLQKPLLKDRPIYIPDFEKLKTFNEQVNPMFNIISENTRENQALITLRDWLLPMLMNGQATISDRYGKLSFNIHPITLVGGES